MHHTSGGREVKRFIRVYDWLDGRQRPARDLNMPGDHWRRKAERGYIAALSGKKGKRNEIAHAILALLDGQGGDDPWRLFRGWRYDRDKRSAKDRLENDATSDALLIQRMTYRHNGHKITIEEAFLLLYETVERDGGDTRPVWRRDCGPWPVIHQEAEALATAIA